MIIILIILTVHWIADFIAQSDKMALNKSTSIYWLTVHVGVYSLFTLALGVWLFKIAYVALLFMIINFGAHWITDFFTSRLNAFLWKKQMRHWFFVAIGFDQLLHYTALLLTYQYLQP